MCKYVELGDKIIVIANVSNSDTEWKLLELGFEVGTPLMSNVIGDDFVKNH